jgi:anti-sigma-K factor RskA
LNVKEYISSGVIESCVLGLATDEEQKELQEVCARYPEIAAAKASFEEALEMQLLSDAIAPPAQLKSQVLDKIKVVTVEQEREETGRAETPVRRLDVWRWVAAASVVLLAGVTWWAFQTNNRYNDLKATAEKMRQQLDAQSNQLATLQNDAEMLRREGMKMVAMHGSQNKTVYSTIYWDTLTKDVYLMVNNLPQPASDQQYQLWALLDGKPIDLGVIEARQQRLLYRMKNVQQAQAFAITLEPRGGRPTPTGAPVVLSNL